jgi:hypothetical protein
MSQKHGASVNEKRSTMLPVQAPRLGFKDFATRSSIVLASQAQRCCNTIHARMNKKLMVCKSEDREAANTFSRQDDLCNQVTYISCLFSLLLENFRPQQ